MTHAFGATRIDHVAVVVTDVDRARAFYGELLGLREVPRPDTFDFPGAWFEIGPMFLHLLGKDSAEPAGQRHFCLWVTDLGRAARHMEFAGIPVQWHAKHKIPGIDRFFIRDPDGNRIEVQGPELGSH